MEHQVRNLTALGLLVLVTAGVFVWGFFFLIGDPILAGGDEVVVVMDDGAGLVRGNPVQLNGVQIGTVRRVQLRPPHGVTVAMKIDGDVRLPADTRAVAGADVFGASVIELVPGSALVTLEGGDTIQGVKRAALPQLATELGEEVRVVLESADSLLSPQAVRDLKATASALPGVAGQLQAAFAELSRATASLRRTAEAMERSEAGANAGEAMGEVRESARAATAALTAMELSLTNLTSVLGKIDRGEGTLGRLVNDTTLYGELYGAIRDFRSLTADVRADPKRYLTVEVF